MEGLVLAVGTAFSSFGEEKEAGSTGRRAHRWEDADDDVYVGSTLGYTGYNMDVGAGPLGSNPDSATYYLCDLGQMI